MQGSENQECPVRQASERTAHTPSFDPVFMLSLDFNDQQNPAMSMQIFYRYQIILGNFNRYLRFTFRATLHHNYALLRFIVVRVATSSAASLPSDSPIKILSAIAASVLSD